MISLHPRICHGGVTRDSWDKTDVEMVDNNSESEQGSSRGSWHRDRLNNAYNVSISFL